MNVNSHELGIGGELGEFNAKEIAEAAAKTEGEDPGQIEAATEAAKRDKENRTLLKMVRESAEEMIGSFQNDPKSLDVLADAYVDSIIDARKQLGRSEDELGVRMMLGAAVKAIGERGQVANTDELVKKIAGSVEAVEKWFAANMPKPASESPEFKNEENAALKLTDAEIDIALANLDKAVQGARPPGAATENRV